MERIPKNIFQIGLCSAVLVSLELVHGRASQDRGPSIL